MAEAGEPLPIRTALFVDFDQVFGALDRIRPSAAIAFATNPGRWLEFFASGLHADNEDGSAELVRRSILVRRCYLNPEGQVRRPDMPSNRSDQHDAFGKYRVYFTRAAFEVIDCPPLTSRGKNSADIVMAMDIMDAMDHRTRFDEFIILSGDADFTPVLFRLRMHDRRTAILADALTAAAYRAACDYQIDQADFITNAIGLPAAFTPRVEHDAEPSDLLDRVADAVVALLREQGPKRFAELTHVFARFPEFLAPNPRWFGKPTLNALVVDLVRRQPMIVRHPVETDLLVLGTGPDEAGLMERILVHVRGRIAAAAVPIPLAALAASVKNAIPELVNQPWPGFEKFKDLLLAAQEPGIAILTKPPGYAYDPARHGQAALEDRDEDHLAGLEPALRSLAARVGQISGCPALLPEEFEALFAALSSELGALADEDEREPGQDYLAGAMHERLASQGLDVPRAAISFVLAGLQNESLDWSGDAALHTPEALVELFRRNTEGQCEAARMVLTEEDRGLLRQWIRAGAAD